ncbi:hypothetical protein [Mycobacteroides abscessus]|uniref:hypothetical protein n=1 Tax=Mycobacteroides abscessus TaxID=36809 RepID=UPI000C25923B|nr:hypothetical protein [Mycobacteroides abscessus]
MVDSPESPKQPPQRPPDAQWATKLLAATAIFLAVITAWIMGASWLAVTARAANGTAHITAAAAFVAAVLGMGWLVRRYLDIAFALVAASPLPNRWRAWRSRRRNPPRPGPPQEWL